MQIVSLTPLLTMALIDWSLVVVLGQDLLSSRLVCFKVSGYGHTLS